MNSSAFGQAMAASPPDMLIHGGDISFNGPAARLDLAYAADEIAALWLLWWAIPGTTISARRRIFPVSTSTSMPSESMRGGTSRRPVVVLRCAALAADRLDTALMGSTAGREREGASSWSRPWRRAARSRDGVGIDIPAVRARTSLARGTPRPDIPITARAKFSTLARLRGEGDRLRAQARYRKSSPSRHGHRLGAGHRHGRRQASARPPRQFSRPGYLEWTLRPNGASHELIEPERNLVIDMTGWTKSNGGTTTTLPAWP